MNLGHVIKKAILSEKAYKDMEVSIYSFLVDDRASKDEIRKAVENQFSTKVQKVNVQAISSKSKRITGTRKVTSVGGGKKARVYLEKGQNITLLSPKKESKLPTVKETKKQPPPTKNEKTEKRGLLARVRGSKEKEEKSK